MNILILKWTYVLVVLMFLFCCESVYAAQQSNDTKISTQQNVTKTSTSATTILVKNSTEAITNKNKTDTTHSRGREGVIDPIKSSTSNTTNQVTETQITNPKPQNITVNIETKKPDEKLNKTMPINNTVNVTATTEKKPIKKHKPKPTFTESDDSIQPQLSSSDEHKNEYKTQKVQSSLDFILDKKSNNRSEYIVPIVAVIMSVPLVAIVISLIYKRSTDWWQHRNYRRMDFLIEGMYNT